MDALTSMITKLAPLRLYDFTGDTLDELELYAGFFDELRAGLDEAQRECFISTAENYGLENREKVFGDVRSEYTAEERRAMLVLRSSLGERDYTAEGLDRFMQSLGVTDYSYTENPDINLFSLQLNGSYPDTEEAWIRGEIEKFLPAHLQNYIYSGGLTWREFDANTVEYSVLDSNDYTWAQLNAMRLTGYTVS